MAFRSLPCVSGCGPGASGPMNGPTEVMTVAWGPFARQCTDTYRSSPCRRHSAPSDRNRPARLIANINVVRVSNLTDLSGARKRGPIKNDEDLTSRAIHSCIRKTETFHTSIVLKNRHFLIQKRLNSIYSDIRASLVNRRA